MTINWVSCSFDYYLVSFYLKYIPGDVFINTAASSLADLTANISSIFIFNGLGSKVSFIGSFILAGVGGFCIGFLDKGGAAIAVFVLIAKFGVGLAFQLCYLAMTEYFPTEISGTTFGVVNIFCRFFTILSPLVAEAPGAWPMMIFTFMCAVALISSLFLRRAVPKVDKAADVQEV